MCKRHYKYCAEEWLLVLYNECKTVHYNSIHLQCHKTLSNCYLIFICSAKLCFPFFLIFLYFIFFPFLQDRTIVCLPWTYLPYLFLYLLQLFYEVWHLCLLPCSAGRVSLPLSLQKVLLSCDIFLVGFINILKDANTSLHSSSWCPKSTILVVHVVVQLKGPFFLLHKSTSLMWIFIIVLNIMKYSFYQRINLVKKSGLNCGLVI